MNKTKEYISNILIRYKYFIRYSAIGVIGVSIDIMLFFLLTRQLHLYYQYANLISVSCGITNNFILNSLINFKKTDRFKRRFVKFYSIGMLGLGLSSLSLYILIDLLSFSQIAAKCFTIVIVTLVQYNLNKFLSFKKYTKHDETKHNFSKDLNVIIPVYNEEAAIKTVLEKWCNELNKLDINYIIHAYNDGSKDSSLKTLNKYASGNNRIVVHDKKNSGHGPTILLGYLENNDAEWIFQTDSDDEIGPESFEILWKKRNDYDFLIGKRSDRRQPFSRKIVSFVSRFIVWTLFTKKVWDVNSPYRLMRYKCFKDYFQVIPKNTFAPNLIISGIASLNRLRIFEIPVQYETRRTGNVSIKKWKLAKATFKSFQQTIGFRLLH